MQKQKCGKLLAGNLFLRAFFMVFVCLAMNIYFFSAQSYATSSSLMGDYKKTAELTDEDRSDAYQKNYQQADKSTDTSFLKTAEWSSKDANEAKITLTAQEALSAKKTRSAVYAFNVCEAHGFSKSIAKKNVDFLLKNFDRVDIIRTGVTTDETVYTMKNIKSFDDIRWPARPAGQGKIISSHRSITLYDGLRKYLKSYKPTCIYVSFDMFYAPGIVGSTDVPIATVTDDKTGALVTTFLSGGQSGDRTTMPGIPETMDEDCFDTLKRYKDEGRYFSMACGYAGKTITKNSGTYVIGGDPEDAVMVKGKQEALGQERFFYSANIIAALADPSVWPGREAAKKRFWNGEAYDPIDAAYSKKLVAEDFNQKFQRFKGIAPDYPYNKDFETMKVSVAKHSLRITDTVADIFEILSATSENPKAIVKIDGNTVSALLEDYDGSAPLTVTIRVKLSENKRPKFDEIAEKWSDTNEGAAKAYFSDNDKVIKVAKVESPKLFIAKEKLPASSWGQLAPHVRRSAHASTKSEPKSKPVTESELESKPATRSELNQPATPDSSKSESPKPDQPKSALSKPAQSKPPSSKSAQPKPAPPRPIQPKTASSKSASPKPAQLKPASKPASKPAFKPIPAKSKRLPGTEDVVNPWTGIGIGVLGVAGIAGALCMRKRKED